MNALLWLLPVLLLSTVTAAYAGKGTFVDEVTFIQYTEESTALEEVRNGNLDIYYSTIPSERIEDAESRRGIHVFESTGGSYSILVNPAEADDFNPFSLREVRFALNYIMDRKLIVNELMGGYGTDIISNYGPHDPSYLDVIGELESFGFRYNPELADKMISGAMLENGAVKEGGVWHFAGRPIEVVVFIRSDDPVRTSIGEILASELEGIGFAVSKDYGDLNKAFVSVYGSDPAVLEWNIYTEGWGGRSAFVKYDAVGLAQMYSPWFSAMPGFNNPAYWNYENAYLDEITQRIYLGDFASAEERADLVRSSTMEGVHEAVRIFLASKVDQYVTNEGVSGIVNDFGAGVPTRFTPINVRTDSDSLTVGVKQIYQGAWNPVMGLSDVYSTQIWGALHDPAIFKHPFSGESFPIRSIWSVETAGPDGALDVSADAILWSIADQRWNRVPEGTQATSVVTFDLNFSNWHHGETMDMNDILYAVYFILEWGLPPEGEDRTIDTEFTPRAAQSAGTLKGIRIVDRDTVQVYVDFWHFDESEIAGWASVWSSVPWELHAAMEKAVLDGKTSFSRSESASKGVSWLSLLIPNDSRMLMGYLVDFEAAGHIPAALAGFADVEYAKSRYDSAAQWIQEWDHAVISNGPFYLERYSPESQFIKVRSFDDPTYPFEAGHWRDFGEPLLPKIVSVGLGDVIRMGSVEEIPVDTVGADTLHYFVTSPTGKRVVAGAGSIANGTFTVLLDEEETASLGAGANDLKLFAVSDSVLLPDVYSTSFLALEAGRELPDGTGVLDENVVQADDYVYALVATAVAVSAVALALCLRRIGVRRWA